MTGCRVLFVSHTGAVSGAEFVLLDIADNWHDASAFVFEGGELSNRLAALGLEVKLARHGSGLSRFRRDGFVWAALGSLRTFAGLVRELIMQSRSVDVIYANSQKAFTLSALAAFIGRKPLVWHLHDILDARHFGKAQRRMQTFLANLSARAVIVPSQAAADAFIAAGGRRDLVKVVPNGRAVQRDARSKMQLRADFGLPTGRLLGVFSRLAAWKGQDIVLRALVQCPDVHGVIVGEALFGEDAFATELTRLVNELDLSDRVSFLGQRSDVRILMQAMDVMVHPSREAEPFGLTLVEAMNVGVPIIASDAGASREILDEGRCGLLVPPGDSGKLAGALAQVFADPDSAAVRTRAATNRAQSVYTVARMQASIRGIIETIGGRR